MLPPPKQLDKASFPHLLKEIPDQPEVLYIKGTMPPADAHFLSVVGSRKATPYGREVCSSIIEGLRGHNIVIISGLALGTDANAHEAALNAGLTTIAIPGSGLGEKVLYPRTNYRLAERILESGGALISEFHEDYKARPESFPQRNRIMAGMSHAVLIVEGELRSGTMITARLATEYNRDVLTVPGSIFSKTCEGPHMLIRLGAVPIRTSSDVLEALGIDDSPTETVDRSNLSENEQHILKILKNPLSREELISQLDLPVHEANALFSALELKGIITERMGKMHIV